MNTADFRYHQYPQGFQFPRRSWTPGYQRTAGHAEDSKRRIGRIIDHPVAVTAYDLFRPLIGITARAAIVVVCIAVSVTVVVIRYTITAIVYLYRRLHPYLKVAVRAAVTSANVAIGVAKRVVTAYNSGRQVWRDRSNPWRLFKSFFPAVDFAIEHRPHIPRPPSPQSDQCSTSSPSPSGSEEANIDGFELNSTPLHGASGEANAVAFPLSPSTAFHADTEVNLDAPIPQSVYQSKESEEPAGANTPLTTTERANLDPQEGCTLPQSEQNLITSVEPTNASSEHPLTPVTATNESTFSDKLSSRSDAACDAIDTEDLGQDLNGQNMDESVESCYLTEEQVEDVRDDETEHFYSHPIQKRSRWRGSSRWSLDSGYAEDTLPFPGH
ncbi:hypothetical protein DFS34DRAFT_595329 [Phlyctochytrium arcticum]|nr:hypothetical protein DFS34DRAFT_595329 [Phlyctochytrium arcticum]